VAVNRTALPFPIAGYEVVEGDGGPAVVLNVPTDRVTVANQPPAATTAGPASRPWGGSPGPDPRAGLPGWEPKEPADG
jgi:hypothetical protein